MQEFQNGNVIYLEDLDVQNGRLVSNEINPATGTPYFSGITLVMIQGSYCGHCTNLKPIFQQLADEVTGQLPIHFATIQVDGVEPTEQAWKGPLLAQLIGHELQGVPHIMRFYDGYALDEYSGDRSLESLYQYVIS